MEEKKFCEGCGRMLPIDFFKDWRVLCMDCGDEVYIEKFGWEAFKELVKRSYCRK